MADTPKKRAARPGPPKRSEPAAARAGGLPRIDPLSGELFPRRTEEIPGAARAAMERAPGSEYALMIESICGPTDDSQPVEQYDGTLGVTVAFVNAHQGPVGQVQWNANLGAIYTNPGNVSGVRWGTGVLITNDLFLTAGHLFDQTGGGWNRPVQNGTLNVIPPAEIATNMHVNFNYQVDPAGNLRPEQQFPILGLVEYRLGNLDFAIVRLGGNPGLTFGTSQVATTDPANGDEICIIGHPAGVPKRIEAGTVLLVQGDLIRYDNIDTLGGNSGSGILRETDGQIVGVHTNGGCNAAGTGSNFGVRVTAIRAQSPTLQALGPTRKAIDDITIKFSDDATRKAIDDITTKLRDDITVKFADDATRKFADDITTKLRDDVTTKLSDDITTKLADDIGTQKFLDDGGTGKSIDDVKQPAFDKGFSDAKSPGSDPIDPGRPAGPWPFAGATIGAQPFILATPHHSMAWAGAAGGGAGSAEAQAAQYEQALAQLQQAIAQGTEELEALHRQYQQLLAEYQALRGGGGWSARADMIAVISSSRDGHATEVLGRLHARGAHATLVDLSEFPRSSELAIEFDGAARPQWTTLTGSGGGSDLGEWRVVWWRRPQPFVLHTELTDATNHSFAYGETHAAFAGLWLTLDAFWINHPCRDEEAARKLYQLKVAREMGFRIPRTCVTNSPAQARDFIGRQGLDRTIYKAFAGTEQAWRETRLLKPEELGQIDSVRFAPVIFQEYIPAEVDLRITVVGDRIFPAAIHSQQTRYKVDFRMDMEAAAITPCELPADLARRLLAYMERLGLVYGAIDMRLTPDGEYVFLEINPAGQWLFVENRAGLPITDALVEVMLARDAPPSRARRA